MDAVSRGVGFSGLFALLVVFGCQSTDSESTSGSFTPRGFSKSFDQFGGTARSQAPESAPTPTPSQSQASPVQPVSAVAPATGPHPKEGTPQIRPIAVIGSDVVITDDEVWQMVRQRAADYVRLTGAARDAKEKEIFEEALRTLIERELILADFFAKVKKNRPQLLDEIQDQATEIAKKQLKEFRRLNGMTNEEDFIRGMRAQGMSPKALQRQIERNTMMNMFLGQLAKEKVKTISLAQLEQYYITHPDEFHMDDRCKWLHLFVSYRRFNTPEEATKYMNGLLTQIKGGADFAEVVKKSGHGDSVLRHGEGAGEKPGEITPRELEPILLKMSAGQTSQVIATDTGLHVVKVLEREHAGVRPFDEKTQTYIRMKIGALIQKQEYERMIEELWRKTTVRIMPTP